MCRSCWISAEPGRLKLSQARWAPQKTCGAGGKLFMLESCPGGNQNLATRVKQRADKSELPNDLALRDSGVWQGRRSAMESTSLSFRGNERLDSHPLVRRPTWKNILKLRTTHTCHTPTRCTERRQPASPTRTAPRRVHGTRMKSIYH